MDSNICHKMKVKPIKSALLYLQKIDVCKV